MCCCEKPTKNGEPGWGWGDGTRGVYPIMPPALAEGETVIFDEPGRCSHGTGGTDSHSHHFTVIRTQRGRVQLLTRHGGGDERIERITNADEFVRALAMLDSDGRYWVLAAMWYHASREKMEARDKEHDRWVKAAAEKRIKTQKQRGRNAVKVWIEDRPAVPA